VRLVDHVLRHGHLSEQALTEAVLTGDRPQHLDRCERCGHRAVYLSRWLDEIKGLETEVVEAAFPVERLAAQQAQIMRRLEQADEPARVLEFPRHYDLATRDSRARRVAPAWVGVAAAAGLAVGVVTGQISARHETVAVQATGAQAAPTVPAAAVAPGRASEATVVKATAPATSGTSGVDDASLLELDLEAFTPETLRVFDEATPRLVSSRYLVSVQQ
jgi:hypothetical protein